MASIGIDLGTTFSCVAVSINDKIEIICNDLGCRTTPSYVAFTDNERIIGEAAKEQAGINPENTIYDTKRLMGRKFNDDGIQRNLKHWPFKVIDCNGNPKFRVKFKKEEKDFCPEEISSMILMKMKETAEVYLNEKVTKAVITVPAYFKDNQRQATKDAGEIAGLDVLKIINEPTAAAIAYGLHKQITEKKNVLIFDLGGGTFDVSIMTIDKNDFKVKAVAGNGHLGGEDFDNRMVTHFVTEIKKKHGIDISGNARTLRRLKTACERAKRILSTRNSATIELVLNDKINFSGSITRSCFDELNSDLFKKTIETVERAMKDSKMKKSEIDDVVLVGGSTRILKIQELLQVFFEGKILNKSINADEAVAYGAAVEAAILDGNSTEFNEIVISDVTPLSFGTDVHGGIMDKIIERNTPIPVSVSTEYVTVYLNQKTIDFKVYEGERLMASKNNLLGNFLLEGIENKPPNKEVIDVTFQIDHNSILTVTAVARDTKNNNKIILKNDNSRLSKEDIDRMIEEAKKHLADDMKQKKAAKALTSLEIVCTNIKSALSNDNLNQHISQNDRKFVLDYCNEIINEMDSLVLADEEDYIIRKNELKKYIECYKIELEN